MALSDLTADAVLKALNEFDQLGREQFLNKYGFAPARSYFVQFEERQYDSKAIAGAAHGYIESNSSPLKAENFSGGESTVSRTLNKLGFEVINTQPRNPDWVRDELILALDFYLKHRSKLPDKGSSELTQLSQQINELDKSLGMSGSDTFRNTNGVYMKLMNFRRLDPDYTDDGKVGLSRGSKAEEVVWNEFANDTARLSAVASAIRDGILTETEATAEQDDDPDFTEAEEGRILTRVHRRRERNRKLVQRKKKAFEEKHGRVFCEACGFDFEKTYGSRGSGFIECHHTKPVHTLKPGDKTNLDDLKLLCSNCHRMVHAKSQWLTFDELQKLVGN